MAVLAVLDCKSGSGKTTIASSIAAWCAQNGWSVVLGDAGPDGSSRDWLVRRSKRAAPVSTWSVDDGRVLRVPRGTRHLVLDVHGAPHVHDLAHLMGTLDAIVVPVGPSYFEREGTVRFFNELRNHHRVVRGHCRLVAVGMRWSRARTHTWLKTQRHWEVPLLTVVPEDARYPLYLRAGSSFFDEVQDRGHPDAQAWLPLVAWLEQVFLELQDAVDFKDEEGASIALAGLPGGALDRSLRMAHDTASSVSSGPRGLVSGTPVSASMEAHARNGSVMGFDPNVPAYLRRARALGSMPESQRTLSHLPGPARSEPSVRDQPVLTTSAVPAVLPVLHDRPQKRWLARLNNRAV